VMKNVAGYDVSRLLVGSLGILGPILEVSLKVLPTPPARTTLRFEWPQAQALAQLQRWAGQPLPLRASAWWSDMLVVQLAGADAAVRSATQALGGDIVDAALAMLAAAAGGHATAFRGSKAGGAFSPLPAPLQRIHRELKARFDPHRLFNPGRLYPDL